METLVVFEEGLPLLHSCLKGSWHCEQDKVHHGHPASIRQVMGMLLWVQEGCRLNQ